MAAPGWQLRHSAFLMKYGCSMTPCLQAVSILDVLVHAKERHSPYYGSLLNYGKCVNLTANQKQSLVRFPEVGPKASLYRQRILPPGTLAQTGSVLISEPTQGHRDSALLAAGLGEPSCTSLPSAKVCAANSAPSLNRAIRGVVLIP